MSKRPGKKRVKVERVQLGVRMEKRLVKVLKAMAEYHDLTLGDLMEGIILYSMEGKSPFNDDAIKRIEQLKLADRPQGSGRFHQLILNKTGLHHHFKPLVYNFEADKIEDVGELIVNLEPTS